MNRKEFRETHSILIEHYQFIERELEGIYAALCGKSFYMGLKDVEVYSINRIIQQIRKQEKIHNKRIISDEEYEVLKSISQRRNYWIHNCYTSMIFDRKTDGPTKKEDIQQLYDDIRIAEQMRQLLFNKKRALMFKDREKLLFG